MRLPLLVRVPPPLARVLAALAVVPAAALSLAGCGIDPTGPEPAGAPGFGVQRPGTKAEFARLYFVGPYGLRAVSRPTDRPLGPQRALDLLLEGPTKAERERGLVSELPAMGGRLTATASRNTVDLYLPVNIRELQVAAVSQLACTAAHADVPGQEPATRVSIRFHENVDATDSPWTVRCDANGGVLPLR
jgi:hypothetical protein